jgi:hypothetical protein
VAPSFGPDRSIGAGFNLSRPREILAKLPEKGLSGLCFYRLALE